MNCKDLQKVLPYIIESGGTPEEDAHLKECAVCSDLVTDLTYIATAAKALLPMQEDPAPRVWENIHSQLQKDGLIAGPKSDGSKTVLTEIAPEIYIFPEDAVSRQESSRTKNRIDESDGDSYSPFPVKLPPPHRSSSLIWGTALAAVAVLALGVFLYRDRLGASSQNPKQSNPGAGQAASAAGSTSQPVDIPVDDDDIQLLAAVDDGNPSSHQNVESSLRSVNQYISDAKQTLAENPHDDGAQGQLMDAYAQKSLLYDLASPSGEMTSTEKERP